MLPDPPIPATPMFTHAVRIARHLPRLCSCKRAERTESALVKCSVETEAAHGNDLIKLFLPS